MSHYHHHHHFRSRFHKWMRTCAIWPSELGLSHLAWWSPVPSLGYIIYCILICSFFFFFTNSLNIYWALIIYKALFALFSELRTLQWARHTSL
jgi:hypothetical protein